MNDSASGTLEREGVGALAHMEEALELLDGCNAPADVGAHLDLAICRLRDVLAEARIETSPKEARSSGLER